MKSTLLIVLLACLMGAMLAVTMSPQQQPADEEFVSEEPLLEP